MVNFFITLLFRNFLSLPIISCTVKYFCKLFRNLQELFSHIIDHFTPKNSTDILIVI